MLEALNSIEWGTLKHFYNDEQEVPTAIKSLISPNTSEHIRALEFLFGSQQDSGTVAETTQYIIPFVLELLADEKYPSKKLLLNELGGLGIEPFAEHYSIRKVRYHLAAYDALESGLQTYFNLVNDPNFEIRQGAIEVLGKLSNSSEIIAQKLVSHFSFEETNEVKITLIDSLDSILSTVDFSQLDIRNQYKEFLKGLVESDYGSQLRHSAARTSIRTSMSNFWGKKIKPDEVSPKVAEILIEEYWKRHSANSQDYIQREIIELLSQLGPEPLEILLNDHRTTPDDAYYVVRGLMFSAINIYHAPSSWREKYWKEHPNFERMPKGNFHTFGNIHFANIPETNRIIRSIVENDIFWKIPTNLFSFFYGLPDDREELRKLIAES
jgi:hypothetical protein